MPGKVTKTKRKSAKTVDSSKVQVQCRLMKAGDIRRVGKIHMEAFKLVDIESGIRAVEDYAGSKQGHGAVVALLGRAIVGYALFDYGDNEMYIANVGVRKSNRGQGVCGRLIPWLLQKLSCFDCKTATLYVVSDTEAASRCYKSHGFVGDSNKLVYKPRRRRSCRSASRAAGKCDSEKCNH